MIAELLFWLAAVALAYAFVGYPLVLLVLNQLRPSPIRREDVTPTVTVVVAAYNEEKNIADKLDNLLKLDYPSDQLDVLVASDASSDRTEQIVSSHPDPRVRLLRVEGRVGKTAVQNEAVRHARGDIVVFTDATTRIDDQGVRQLVRSFADPRTGCAGGQLSYVSTLATGVGSGGRSYWAYERRLKAMESNICSLIGVSGCFYAVRRELYEDIAPDLISDFVIALLTYQKGHRVVYEPEARSYEETLEDPGAEFRMRERVALRSYRALYRMRHMLNPFRYGLFAIQLISHKVFRYLVPVFLIALLASSIALAGNAFYAAALVCQLLAYGVALVGYLRSHHGRVRGLLYKPYYFVLANGALLSAWLKFLRGQRMVTWTPIR